MAETVEAVRLVDKHKLPDELAGFESLRKNGSGRLEGVSAQGETKTIPHVGELLMKTLVNLNTAEETASEPPEAAELKERVRQLQEQLETERREHAGEIKKLRTDFAAQLEERDNRLEDMDEALTALTAKLTEKGVLELGDKTEIDRKAASSEKDESEEIKGLKKRLDALESIVEGKKPPEPVEYEGFKKDDSVGLKSGEKYVIGYEVKGFTEPDEEGKRKVIIRKEGGPERAVEPSELKKSEDISADEIEKEEPEVIEEYAGFEIGDKVGVKSGDKYIVGYQVTGFTEPDQHDRRKIKIEQEDGDEERVVHPSALKKRGEIDDEEIAGYRPEPAPAENRRRLALAVAAGAAAVGATALITWLLTRHGGPDISSLKIQENNHHLAEMNAIAAAKNDELKAISALDTHISNELWHDHQHELRKITDYGNALEKLARHQQNSTGFKDHLQGTGAYWGVRYPWDWAANKVGAFKAEGWLHTLAAKAAEHGHKVRWLTGGHGTEILQLDGHTDTGYVVSTLKRY